eukprot:14551-Heterococcus_DN1.PRE.4
MFVCTTHLLPSAVVQVSVWAYALWSEHLTAKVSALASISSNQQQSVQHRRHEYEAAACMHT